MKKLPDEARYIIPPNIDSMYIFLPHILGMWQESYNAKQKDLREGKTPSEMSNLANLTSACKYYLIMNSYGLLDAAINTYVALNHFETEKNENDQSVYAKWKNFPYAIEKKNFKKQEIRIIDEIRILRNQIAHPSPYNTPITNHPLSFAQHHKILELTLEDGEIIKKYVNFMPEFTLANGAYLLNEVSHLTLLARNTLNNSEFLPNYKMEILNIPEKWKKNISVI